MKNLVIFILSFFVFSSVSAQDVGKRYFEDNPANATDSLYAMGSRNRIFEDDSIPLGHGCTVKMSLPEEFAFTGDAIQSYNLTTKEIVFADSVFNKVLTTYSIFNVYFNDTLLIENIAETGDYASWIINDLVLYSDSRDNKLYLCFISPGWDIDTYFDIVGDTTDEQKEAKSVLQKRLEMRNAELDSFIQYLNDRSKIITGIEDVKQALPVQIYSTGKTIHVNNLTGKNGVITVYGIDGVKVAEQAMAGQTTKLEIPVSGIYLVSVKAGNEKPITAKLMLHASR